MAETTKVIDINVEPQIKRLIKHGEKGKKKTVEVRPFTGRGRFAFLKAGDLIQFCGDSHCLRRVTEIRHYDSIQRLIENEDPTAIWPGRDRNWLTLLARKKMEGKPAYWKPPFIAIQFSEL